jgi:urease accessory protein
MHRTLMFILLSLPVAASAHIGSHDNAGFGSGFLHPVTGSDHLLAMLGVGLLAMTAARRQPGHLPWFLPAAFIGGMTAGILAGALAIGGDVMASAAENLIVLSLFAIGLALLAGGWAPALPASAFVAAFALFHGYAHGAELPAQANAAAYIAGILLATTALHLGGMLAGYTLTRLPRGDWLLRACGAGTLLFGVSLLA